MLEETTVSSEDVGKTTSKQGTKKMTVYVYRPQVNYFEQIKFTNKQLDQQCKLVRNQAASLDLGNPHFKLFTYSDTPDLSSKERYLDWVKDWKSTYALLSDCIRGLKSQRKFSATIALEEKLVKVNPQWSNLTEGDLHTSNLSRIAHSKLELKRAAQVMLNARYNAKLAAGELRRRRLAAETNSSVAEVV